MGNSRESFYADGSDMFNGSFSVKGSVKGSKKSNIRGTFKGSPPPKIEPIALQDYYSDCNFSAEETPRENLTILDEFADLAFRKK